MNTSEIADLTVARLRSHEGGLDYSRLRDRGIPRSARIVQAIYAVTGKEDYLAYEDLGVMVDEIDTRILGGALLPGGKVGTYERR